MKYSTTIEILLPIEDVIKKLNHPENMKHWQRGLINYELLSGTPGQPGAKMKLNYEMGKRKLSMIETVLENNLPSHFHVTYETQGVFNTQRNFFTEVDANTTQWHSESEFKFDSFGMKLLGWLMPGAFKKQSMKYLTDFKNFAEKGTSVAPS